MIERIDATVEQLRHIGQRVDLLGDRIEGSTPVAGGAEKPQGNPGYCLLSSLSDLEYTVSILSNAINRLETHLLTNTNQTVIGATRAYT